ncbi:PD-(D/E)XK nuclease family protein [Spirillospora sp. NPDC049652]
MNTTPPGTHDDPRLVRVGLPVLQQDPRDCPRAAALHVRPLAQADRRAPWAELEGFALGPFMRVLDRFEHHGVELDRALTEDASFRRCLPAHRHWTADAVHTYLAARERSERLRTDAGHPATLPVRHEWVAIHHAAHPDARGAQRYERYAWGRRYASADGLVRELWLLSVNELKLDRAPAQIAAAASVLAFGVPAKKSRHTRWYEPVGVNVPPARVRVIGVGCGDGEFEVLADWDVHEVSERYDKLAKSVLTQVMGRSELVPGSDCVGCKALAECPEPPRTPGLLQVPAPARPRERRSVSASDLRRHSECPAAFHLTRVLHLNDGRPENAAIRRGRAVDAVLNESHRRRPRKGCRDMPMPEALPDLPPDEADTATRMLAQHRGVCPLDGLPAHEQVLVQPRLTAYDPELDTVVIADPDLLHTDAGGWVWRETKTVSRPLWEGRSLLATYPQLALAVGMMAAGVPGGDPRRCRIELEVLRADGVSCEEIDPFDASTLDEARTVLAALTGPWAADQTCAPNPGPYCASCEVRRWCPSRQQEAAR